MSIELKNIPENSGVYIMKNKDDKIIYIGKAKNLKKRVSTYFNRVNNQKTAQLVKNIVNIDFFLCNTEIEALILENNLIKKYKPKYNILLKDQKTYPYIKVTKESLPKISFVRSSNKFSENNAYYFGPYPNMNIKKVINMLMKVFKIRDCNIDVYKKNTRPCLKYHMNLCNAPCHFKNEKTQNEYIENCKNLVSFLENKDISILKDIEKKMNEYSDNFNFENAIIERERIITLKKLIENQIIEDIRKYDEDIFTISNANQDIFLCVMSIRDGKMINKSINIIDNVIEEENIIERLILSYYENIKPPQTIILDYKYKEKELILKKWFFEDKKINIKLLFPKKSCREYRLLELAKLNLDSEKSSYYNKKENLIKKLINLKEILNLQTVPYKIECYDISNISGSDNVGTQVVFVNGEKNTKLYKKYNIKTVLGQDDYNSMKEMLQRRLKYGNFPDLILLDGGKGHVNKIKKLLKKEKLNIDVYGMYKDNNHRTVGLCDEKNIIDLHQHDFIFKLITSFQDEVHRFAINHHRKLRSKRNIKSSLDEINGIGSVRKKKLLLKFGNVLNIKKATIEELESILPKRVAKELMEKL